jgi:hypothetical protein
MVRLSKCRPVASAWLLIVASGCCAVVLAACRCEGREYYLSLSVSAWSTGTGKVSADPPGPYYSTGAEVEVSAVADVGSILWGWKDATCGKYDSIGNPNPVVMDGNKDLRATFARPEIPGNGVDDDLDGQVDE